MALGRELGQCGVVLVLVLILFLSAGCVPGGALNDVVSPSPEAVQPEASRAPQSGNAGSLLATPSRTPAPTPIATNTLVVVTATFTPENVFAAATWVVQRTAQARDVGTATPLPPNVVVATFTPWPIVAPYLPTAANQATAEARSREATAIAFTTGTPNPLTPVVTATPTPVMIYVKDLGPGPSPTPSPVFPSVLAGKILFLSDMGGESKAQVYAMDPDGSDVARLTGQWPYSRAQARDALSAGGTFRVYARPVDGTGQVGRAQIFYADLASGVEHQVTFFETGGAASPAWAPAQDLVAFVSNESGSEEIWTVEKGNWPATQLTHDSEGAQRHPSWSPDGRRIVFSSNLDGKEQLWIMNADGSNPRPISDPAFNAWDPVWVKPAAW